MKQNKNGFTLMEMLIVIAIIAVLIAVAIPVFASQLEKAREATDLANVRSAYAQVSTEALLGDSEATVTVNLKQKQADWQSVDPVNIGGIIHLAARCTLFQSGYFKVASSCIKSRCHTSWPCPNNDGIVHNFSFFYYFCSLF